MEPALDGERVSLVKFTRSGAKLEIVAKILGHAGVGVTGDIYRHVCSAELHETAQQFAPLNRLPPILLAERT